MANETLSFDVIARTATANASFVALGKTVAGASGNLRDLSEDLDRVAHQTAEARVELAGDKEAQAELDKIGAKLISLSKRKADPKVDMAGYLRTRSQITAVELALDRLDGKKATVTVDVNRGGLRGLLGRLGGGGAGGGFLESLRGGGGLGALGTFLPAGLVLGAGLAPGVAGLGLGLGAGGAAIGGGLFGAAQGNKIIAADQAQIRTITAALKTAIGKQKTELSQALKDANKQLNKDTNFFAPFIAMQGALKDLMLTFLKPLRPVMQPLIGIINEFGKGLAGLGPQFTALFQASLPFIRQFLQFLLQAGKSLLPAFTQALNEMVKSGALNLMTQGLVILTQGLATFIRNLGPGMKASAEIFKRVSQIIGDILGFLGDTFTVIAKVIEFKWGDLWRALVGSFRAFWHNVAASFDAFRHAMAASFDAFRHDVAAIWDTIWRNTVTRVQNGISDVVGWFKRLPGMAIHALWGFGHSLAAFARAAFTEMWDAIKNVGGDIWHWLTSWVSRLPGWLKKLLHINSPSGVFYDIGKQMMLGLFHGIRDHAKQAKAAVWDVGNIKFNPSLGVTQWGPLVRRALLMEGLNPLLAARVMYQMQTESGGNPRAINLTDSNAAMGDPSRGLMQVIGSTFAAYHWPGTSWNIYNPLANIAAALNYARHVYGPTLMRNGQGIGSGHGYAFGTPSAAAGWAWVGERGPELVNFRGGEQVYPAQAGVGRGGGAPTAVVELRASRGDRYGQFLLNEIQRLVRDHGGDVQVAFGTSY